MAGEYSPGTFDEKVYQEGACRLVKLGFRQGGAAGYGLRRVLVDVNGVKKGIELKMGEQKSIQTDRAWCWSPGPRTRRLPSMRRILHHEFVTDVEI